jgi:peptidoglycan/LPS O-acetylase OafA/YrhL
MLLTDTPRGPAEGQRLASLDMLRALAVFLVIGHHSSWRFRPEVGDPIAHIFKGSGWIGVDIFFAISGFMITSILWRDHQHIKAFFVRRFYRIVPIFAVAMASFVLVSLATGLAAERLRWAWSPALFLNGWTIPFIGVGVVPFTITWSLSVEESAYLILGFAALAGRKGIRAALLCMLILPPLVRIAVVAGGWFDAADLYFFVPARLDSIAFGGLAAISAAPMRYRRWQAPLAGCAMFFMIWLFQFTRISDPRLILVGYTVFSFTAALFVASLAAADAHQGSPRGILRPLSGVAGWVATFGRLSYFIYLFHVFVLEALLHLQKRGHLSLTFWQALALASAIVFAMAAVSWKYFESPLIRKGRERTAAAPPGAGIHSSAQAPT